MSRQIARAMCLFLFSTLFSSPCYCKVVNRSGLVYNPDRIESVKGKIDSLKRNYEFREWSLIIRDIWEKALNDRKRMLLLADGPIFRWIIPSLTVCMPICLPGIPKM